MYRKGTTILDTLQKLKILWIHKVDYLVLICAVLFWKLTQNYTMLVPTLTVAVKQFVSIRLEDSLWKGLDAITFSTDKNFKTFSAKKISNALRGRKHTSRARYSLIRLQNALQRKL